MVESLQTSAQLTTVVEVDVTRIAALRGRIKADFESREGVKLSFLPFFCKAAVEALKVYPQINSSIDMDAGIITYHDSENLGIAVDTNVFSHDVLNGLNSSAYVAHAESGWSKIARSSSWRAVS